MKNERIKWIDALRAMAIFFVVMGHLYTGNSLYFILTSPINLPVFYFLAGYVFNTNKKWGEFLKGIALRIYIPYLIFSLFPLKTARFLLQGNVPGLWEYWAAFFSGRIVWFIPSFVLTQIFVYMLYRAFRGNAARMTVASILCFVVGVNTADVEWMDFWCINTALTAVLYMSFGLLMKQYGTAFPISSGKAIATNAMIYLCGVICTVRFYPGSTLDVHLDSYYNVPICLILIVSGILLCMGVAQKIPWGKGTGPWLILGQETLMVFLTHSTIQFVLSKLLCQILPLNGNRFWRSMFYTILTCMVGTVISRGIGRLIPELVGKQRSASRKSLPKAGI